jgi:hypothetical protein
MSEFGRMPSSLAPPPAPASQLAAGPSTLPRSTSTAGAAAAPSARPLRVSQLDSLELDDALSSMLTEQVSSSLDNFSVRPVAGRM